MEYDSFLKIENFFKICFKIKQKHDGRTTVENAKRYIGLEFILAPEGEATQRYFEEMLFAKFLLIGINGIIVNQNLDEDYQKFLKEKK